MSLQNGEVLSVLLLLLGVTEQSVLAVFFIQMAVVCT